MAIPIPLCISRFTPIIFLYLLFLPSTAAVNITTLLSPFPDLSDFSDLLSTTAVAGDLLRRNSITLLAVPNSILRSSALLRRPSANLADVLRYHVLLQYLSPGDLRRLPPAGKLITTLLQTTGRSSAGDANVTHDAATDTTTVRTTTGGDSNNNATVIAAVVTLPYNVSILTVDSLIVPSGFDLTASEARPPLGINVTGTLIAARSFNVAAAMLSASGVIQEFESEKGGAGITLFVPTDDAFSNIPATENFQSLPADQKSDVLRFHVLLSYYPLGSLESIVNPFQPTLATEDKGAGTFTLNISRVNGSVGIRTGIVEASVIQTVIDQNPIAIFGVSRVLLPKEIFGKKDLVEGTEPPVMAAPPPVPELGGTPLSSPGVREEMSSPAAVVRNVDLGLYLCIGLVYMYLLI